MTLNQVIKRIKTIALAHLQIKRCEYGEIEDILVDKKDLYALLWLTDNGAAIFNTGNTATFNFRFFFLDLVNVASDTEDNQVDVQSDMFSVAKDIFAQINNSVYSDWKIDGISPGQIIFDSENDVVSGVVFDVGITTIYDQDVCAVPTVPPTAETALIEYGWFDSNPYLDIDTADFLFSESITSGIPSYDLDFAESNKFLAIKEPANEPEKTAWYNSDLVQGVFGDSTFRLPVIIAGFRYYVIRDTVDFNTLTISE